MPYKSTIGRETTILYTQKEAADLIGVCPRTLRNYLRAGRIPYVKIRGHVYIWDQHLKQYIRGARSTRTYEKIEPPQYDALTFDGPPDPFYDEQGNNIFETRQEGAPRNDTRLP